MTAGTPGLGSTDQPGPSSDSKALESSSWSASRKPVTIEVPSTSYTTSQPRQQRKGSEIETISSRICGVTHKEESRIAIDEEEKAIGSTSDFSLIVPKTGPPSEPSTTHGDGERGLEDEEGVHVKHHTSKGSARVPLIQDGKKERRKSDSKEGNKARGVKEGKKGEKEVEKWESSNLTSGEKSGCNWYV